MSRIERNAEPLAEGAPVAHNKALRRLWPCIVHARDTHTRVATHRHRRAHTDRPTDTTPRNRAVPTLPCCTTNESPSLSPPAPHPSSRASSNQPAYAHIYRRYRFDRYRLYRILSAFLARVLFDSVHRPHRPPRSTRIVATSLSRVAYVDYVRGVHFQSSHLTV